MTGKENKDNIKFKTHGKQEVILETLAFQENETQSHLQNINQSIKYEHKCLFILC